MSKTGIFLVAIAIIVVIWELWAFTFGGDGSVISAVIKAAGIENPGLLVGSAYIAGHIFSMQPCPKTTCSNCGTSSLKIKILKCDKCP